MLELSLFAVGLLMKGAFALDSHLLRESDRVLVGDDLVEAIDKAGDSHLAAGKHHLHLAHSVHRPELRHPETLMNVCGCCGVACLVDRSLTSLIFGQAPSTSSSKASNCPTQKHK